MNVLVNFHVRVTMQFKSLRNSCLSYAIYFADVIILKIDFKTFSSSLGLVFFAFNSFYNVSLTASVYSASERAGVQANRINITYNKTLQCHRNGFQYQYIHSFVNMGGGQRKLKC